MALTSDLWSGGTAGLYLESEMPPLAVQSRVTFVSLPQLAQLINLVEISFLRPLRKSQGKALAFSWPDLSVCLSSTELRSTDGLSPSKGNHPFSLSQHICCFDPGYEKTVGSIVTVFSPD